MIILRSPKGWTGPKEVDGLKTEGFWRSHQVPLADMKSEHHLRQLEQWLRSYHPETLFDESGRLRPELRALAPQGNRRMSANPHANGGLLCQPLTLPDVGDHAIAVPSPGGVTAESTRIMGRYLADMVRANAPRQNFRLVGPDETTSNRLDAVVTESSRAWMAQRLPDDTDLSPEGRVLEILSETTCQGWLEGYLLTGRHGLFSCYEAFIHIVDSMFNQHAKWLDACSDLPWRKPIASLNYLLTSHVWRQDHNGFSHQDPGFIDVALNKKPSIVRVYLPPDANTLLWTTRHILETRNRINIVVAGKQPSPQWLAPDAAQAHCKAGLGKWEWASNEDNEEPDIVLACAGDIPTLETLAAVDILRRHLPVLKIRVLNVVDLLTLMPAEVHPHGLPEDRFDALFTTNRPVLFAYHGYPWTIHRLTYRRANHDNIHVRGYQEEGTTTTPFDMTVLNRLDRFHLVLDVLGYVPGLPADAEALRSNMLEKLDQHWRYIREHGEDLPEIRHWTWPTPNRA
jgi:xylulose-5-phosphate/fructose-6-phosphate phosphoketolase